MCCPHVPTKSAVGSTGSPRGQESPSLGMVSQCLAVRDAMGKGPGDKGLCTSPMLCQPWLPLTCCVGHMAT